MKFSVNCTNLFVVLIFVSLGVVLAEPLKLVLDLIQVLLEDLLLEDHFVFNLISVLSKSPLLGFDESSNTEDLSVALSNDLGLLIFKVQVSVIIEEAEPVN